MSGQFQADGKTGSPVSAARTGAVGGFAVVPLQQGALGPVLIAGLGMASIGFLIFAYYLVSWVLDRTTSSVDSSPEPEPQESTAEVEEMTLGEVIQEIDSRFDHVVDDPEYLARDFVAADSIQWNKRSAVLDEGVARTYYVDSWPDVAETNFLNGLFANTSLDIDITIHVEPRSVEQARDELDNLYSEITSEQMTESSGSVLSKQDLERAREMIETMRDLVSSGGRRVIDVSVYATVRAEDSEELRYADRQIKEAIERDGGMVVRPAKWRQDRAMRSASPNGIDVLNKKRAMLGDAVAATFPFSSSTLIEPSGVYVGLNPRDGSPVMMDPWERTNGFNRLTLGMIGSGKSFSSKQFILRAALAKPDLDVVIIDPMGGFTGVNLALNGDRIVVDGTEGINPMHIEPTPEEVIKKADGQIDPYGTKIQDVRWFFDRFFHMRGEELGSEKWGVLDRGIKMAYQRKGITEDIETHSNDSPTVRDVMDILEEIANDPRSSAATDSDAEVAMWGEMASSLLMSLEPFREGNSLGNLAEPTDIELGDSSCTYVDMQQVSARDDTSGLMMQLLFSMLYQEMKNAQNEVMFVIDEAHKIMRDSKQLGFLEEVFRHSRHYLMSINLISQTPEEFYINDAAKAIADQCSIKQIHRVNSIDEEIAKTYMGLSDRQIEYIQSATTGSGDKNYSEALLNLSDHGYMPLRIYATDEEKAVIDYEPDEVTGEDLTTANATRIRRAIVEAQQMDIPVSHPELADDDLVKAARQAAKDRVARSLPVGEGEEESSDESAVEAGGGNTAEAEPDGGRMTSGSDRSDD